jgi:hypothetical protein
MQASYRTTSVVAHAIATLLWAAVAIGYLAPMPATILIGIHGALVLAISLLPMAADLGMVAVMEFGSLAVKWVLIDQVIRRIQGPLRVPELRPIGNREFALGIALCLVVLGCAAAADRILRAVDALSRRSTRQTLYLMVPILVLCIGCVEIDRYALTQTAGPVWIVRQVGWSIWWAIASVICLVAGFAWKARHARLFALALLGATLIKIVAVDLSGAGTGWRILSFIGLGAVLLGTSVLYGKYGERMAEIAGLREEGTERDGADDARDSQAE